MQLVVLDIESNTPRITRLGAARAPSPIRMKRLVASAKTRIQLVARAEKIPFAAFRIWVGYVFRSWTIDIIETYVDRSTNFTDI